MKIYTHLLITYAYVVLTDLTGGEVSFSQITCGMQSCAN